MSERMMTRALMDIEADIRARKRNITLDCLAIGRDLTEAKEQLEHGAWLTWLEKMEFAPRTAENWMRLAREIGPESSLASLPYTKALALLQAPAEDREQLAKDAEDKTVAEIKGLIQEINNEKRTRILAQEKAEEYRRGLASKELEIKQAMNGQDALRKQVDELLANPKTVEVEPPDYADLKEAVEKLSVENEELSMAVEEAEKRASAAWAGGARQEKRLVDPMELTSAVTDFLGRVELMANGDQEIRALPERELRSVELCIGSISSWCRRMEKCLGKARLQVCGDEGAIV